MRRQLIIDKISVTLPVDPSHRINVVERLTQLCNGPAPVDLGRLRHRNGYNSYRHTFWIRLGNNARCLLQAGPTRSSGDPNFFRLEWNPSKSRNSLGDIVQVFRDVMPDFTLEEFFRLARITRIDFAFDLRRIPIEAIGVFAMLRRPYSAMYQTHTIFDPFGRLNSLEIGLRRGKVELLVYDKLLEQKSRQIDDFPCLDWLSPVPRDFAPTQQVPITARRDVLSDREYRRLQQSYLAPIITQRQTARPVIRPARTRVELRLKEDIGNFSQLDSMPNPFARYTFFMHDAVQSARAGHEWSHFVDSCRHRGAQCALSLIEDDRTRHRYRDALRAQRAPAWWNPEVIWAERRAAILSMVSQPPGSEGQH